MSANIGAHELIVDLFAGGGGASTGIEMALGRSPDIAINHSPAAIAMHAINHPTTRHFCENVWKVVPREVCGGRPVGLLHASPDCTHHSRAKGGKPKNKKLRSLASVVIRWARDVAPRVIVLENVEEWLAWGPLDNEGNPIKAKAGRSNPRATPALCGGSVTPSRRIRLRAELVAALAWVTEAQRQVRRDVLPHVPPQCAAMWPRAAS